MQAGWEQAGWRDKCKAMSLGLGICTRGCQACRAPHEIHSVAVSLMEGGVRTTSLGPLEAQGCFQFIRGSSGCVHGVGEREGCGGIF